MILDYDIHAASLKKAGERQCGDVAEIGRPEDGVCALLADGLGSGFTASLHAGLTARLIMSMITRGEGLDRIIEVVAGNMEVNRSRRTDYCAFTLLCASRDGELSAAVLNMPEPVLLRRGKPFSPRIETVVVGKRVVKTLRTRLFPYDTVAIFSDGVTKAGVGGRLNLGLGRKRAAAYLEAAYRPHISAEKLAQLLIEVCDSLYFGRPGDDVSAVVMRAKNASAPLRRRSAQKSDLLVGETGAVQNADA